VELKIARECAPTENRLYPRTVHNNFLLIGCTTALVGRKVMVFGPVLDAAVRMLVLCLGLVLLCRAKKNP
jgi:hypothetical protein